MGWCVGCRDIGFSFAYYPAVFEPSGGGTKNKVGGAFYMAVFKVLPLACSFVSSGVYCILIAYKPAIEKYDAVAFGVQGYCLP